MENPQEKTLKNVDKIHDFIYQLLQSIKTYILSIFELKIKIINV